MQKCPFRTNQNSKFNLLYLEQGHSEKYNRVCALILNDMLINENDETSGDDEPKYESESESDSDNTDEE